MRESIGFALFTPQRTLRSVCAVAALDRPGVLPGDFDPSEQKGGVANLQARGYSPEELVDPQRGLLLKQGRSTSPCRNCTRGRCCRRRSWLVRRPARPPGSPPGFSAI